jgi:hypothetical protein
MKTLIFRPLRRIKKTGKIVVASYPLWRKIKTADYNSFILVIDDEYKTLPADEYVYNHKGENLFWRDFDPEQISVLPPYILRGDDFEYPYPWKSVLEFDGIINIHYSAPGLDCDGVPAFAHYTATDIFNGRSDMTNFEPLTVGMVRKWFWWFLYQLNNSKLTILKN